MDDASVGAVGTGRLDAGPTPAVAVRIRSFDCGKCFELRAEGSGGSPPYEFEWTDGSRGADRVVCIDAAEVALSVVAIDAERARSTAQTIHLTRDADAECAPPRVATDAGSSLGLCLQNLSFEGTPGINSGQDLAFDAEPWNACTNPLADNTPDIGNESVAVTPGVPAPVDGQTYLALAEGEQVSQTLCSDAPLDTVLSFQIDLARVDLSGGVVPESEQVFLELWSGLSVDCSQHELLWASPALQSGWHRFCFSVQPHSYMTQLTLRANADMTLVTPAYLLVDNMQPVDGCP